MEITRIGLHEIEDLLRLQRTAWQSEAEVYEDFDIPPLQQTLDELLDEISSATCLVAREYGVVVGAVSASMQGDVCLVSRLVVEPAEQRRGIGTRLLQHIETAFPQAQVYEVFTGHRSHGNLALYGRLGYQMVRQERLNPRITLVYLRKTRA